MPDRELRPESTKSTAAPTIQHDQDERGGGSMLAEAQARAAAYDAKPKTDAEQKNIPARLIGQKATPGDEDHTWTLDLGAGSVQGVRDGLAVHIEPAKGVIGIFIGKTQNTTYSSCQVVVAKDKYLGNKQFLIAP